MKLKKMFSDFLSTDIGQKQPLRVLIRFAYLQARKRFSSKPFVFTTCTGSKAYVQRGVDTTGSALLFYFGIHELSEVVCLWHLLRPGEIFFDIGANQGSWGLILAPKGVVCHEFEPCSSTFKSLQKQIELNPPQIRSFLHPHRCAISDQDGSAMVTTHCGLGNHLVLDEGSDDYLGNQYEKVSSYTLDRVADMYGIPTAIKIDTEGFTNEVLKGGPAVLGNSQLRVIVIETFRYADGLSPRHIEIETILAEHGFYPYDYDPSTRSLSLITDPLGGRQDTIYLRASDEDLLRLRDSISIKVSGYSF